MNLAGDYPNMEPADLSVHCMMKEILLCIRQMKTIWRICVLFVYIVETPCTILCYKLTYRSRIEWNKRPLLLLNNFSPDSPCIRLSESHLKNYSTRRRTVTKNGTNPFIRIRQKMKLAGTRSCNTQSVKLSKRISVHGTSIAEIISGVIYT
jgi:hypothetical protein